MKIKFKKINKNIIGISEPAIVGDVGYDFYTSEAKVLKAKSSNVFSTGVMIELPENYWMNIAPKSGLATKHEINVHAGVIDNGYRGEIKIMLYNHSDKDYFFNKNEKIAQGIIRKSYVFELEESDELSTTIRDKDGFGSTGK